MSQTNPFALVRASDYTDAQINSLWVELGSSVINQVIEPTATKSKFILGGKGSGKTHLLRYHSYQVARLRSPKESGMTVVERLKFLAIFQRATALDSYRFEETAEVSNKWQQLFGVYLELQLAEGVLDAMCDIKASTPDGTFDDAAFIRVLSGSIVDPTISSYQSIDELRAWVVETKRQIDDAVNNSAFTGALDVKVFFSIGALCLPIKRALVQWNAAFEAIPLLYLLDEIENFSEHQQQVVHSLIRYGEGLATFRVTGRLYARKTTKTIGGGEENLEGAEFTTTNLDRILKAYPKYGQFAQKFVQKRLGFKPPKTGNAFDPHRCFDEVNSEEYYGHSFDVVGIDPNDTNYLRAFSNALKEAPRKLSANDVKSITETLTEGVPLILRKLNALRFCKQYSNAKSPLRVAQKIKDECLVFMQGRSLKSSYANAYGHYKNDLFAQLCRDSKKARGGVPYAGFETFITMSSGNPRNLLIILGKAYEIAAFRELDFINGSPLSIALQTEAAIEAAHFMYERDTNYGSESDLARGATERLALVLRTARYALNIPEVSPLAVSFSEEELSPNARAVLNYALNYSLVFEVYDGRPDRNSQRVQKKIQLNPLLSPKWGLPIGRRGDISLSAALVNAIFDSTKQGDFNILLNALDLKWNHPFGVSSNLTQVDLF